MRIIFFSPFCSRNGAEIMLNYLASTLPKDIESYFFFGKSGNLKSSVTHKFFISKQHSGFPYNFFNKVALTLFKKEWIEYEIERAQKRIKADIWYLNTVHMPQVAKVAKRLKIPYILHFHDLIFQYQFIEGNLLSMMVKNAKVCVGCSDLVVENLKILGAKKVKKINECIDIRKINESIRNKGLNIRKKFSIPESDIIWIMSGTVNYRKGIDIVPLIAKELSVGYSFFVMGSGGSGYEFFLKEYLRFYNINNLYFINEQNEDYYSILNQSDGFLLSSREDPFPLVMLEAAYLKKPIVSYNSGGISEFLKPEMGIIVQEFNVNRFVEAIKQVSSEYNFNPKVTYNRAKEFDGKVQSMQLFNIINQL